MGRYLGVEFLKEGIVEPQEDVPPPVSLLLTRRHLRDRALIHLPDPLERVSGPVLTPVRVLLESGIVEPDVIVARLVRQLFLVLQAALAEHGHFDAGPVAELFLKVGVGGVELGRARPRQPLEGEL